MTVDRLDHHFVLGELLQPPDQEVEPGLVPLVTVQVEELEWCLEAETISEILTSLSFGEPEISQAGLFIFPLLSRKIFIPFLRVLLL